MVAGGEAFPAGLSLQGSGPHCRMVHALWKCVFGVPHKRDGVGNP